MNCFEELSNKFASEDCPIYLSKLSSIFSRTKTFCFENSIFFLTLSLGMREGVSEGSRHGSWWVTFSSISCRHLSRDLHVLLECVCAEPLHVHLGGE